MIDIRAVYGKTVVLENCIVGQNLNLLSIRGYARLDVLAAISAPDVFDQVNNPQGTQRDLDKGRSREALAYAMEAVSMESATDPRAFTEVILNVRDKAVIQIIDIESDAEVEFNSHAGINEVLSQRVEIRVNLGEMQIPAPEFDPQISRVDGNHRLSSVLDLEAEILEDVETLPWVAFSIFVGLDPDQERAIFRDINSKQQKMETAHLDQIRLKLEGKGLLAAEKTKKEWALWVANELAAPGKPFDGLVFFGGSRRGIKAAGIKPILKLNALRDTVRFSIVDSVEQTFFVIDPQAEAQMTAAEVENERLSNARMFAMLLDWYWQAVRSAFPEAWQNKRDYILFQSIGLYGFGALAARVIAMLTAENQLEPKHFDAMLSTVSRKVNLSRDNPAWEGVAGMAGGRKVLKALETALDLPGANLTALRQRVLPKKSALEE